MKKINKKIFPEDFFDLNNNQDELTHTKKKSKQKDHPKLLNPSNTIKIIPNVINEIKEEAFEESVEQFQPKKTNLKIIIPEKSNDELEPSTSGSSNVKLSPNKPSSPLVCIDKNKFNLFPDNKDKEKEEDKYKVTAHFVKEENSNTSFNENKNFNRPFTPNVNRYKNIYNPPLTCDNKNLDKLKFNYNFETKKNGAIVPKKDSKINQIQRQNLFKVSYNNNSNRNNKNKNNKKLKPVSSRIEQIFGTQGNNNSPKNSSLVSIINLNEKNQNKNKNKEYNTNIINNNKKNNNINDLKKANNCNHAQKNPKKSRANSVENKYMNRKNNVLRKIESNNDINKNNKDINVNKNGNNNNNKEKERKKNYSNNNNKNNGYSYLPEIKYANVKNQLEVEVNNLFQNLPEDFEKYPELKNYVDLIVQNIHGLKDYIYKNTQDFFKKNRNNSSKNRK